MSIRKLAALGIAGTLIVGLSACGSESEGGAKLPDTSKSQSQSTGSDKPGEKAAPNTADVHWGQHVSEAEFKKAVEGGAQVIDVRTPEEFASGHIPGAININVNASDATAKFKELDPNKSYAVYCRSGARSRSALGRMQGQGLKQVIGLEGGITHWSGPTE